LRHQVLLQHLLNKRTIL